MLPYRDSKITRIVLILFFVLVLLYAFFEAQGYLLGPSIQVSHGVQEVHDPLVRIKGRADRISSLSMNGKQIPVTEDGSFDQPYLLSEGDNRIVLDAKDTYGRTTRSVLEIVYTPLAASTTPSTSSTSSPQAATTTSAK